MSSSRPAGSLVSGRPLAEDDRGAVFAEYIVVLICVSIVVALAVASLGVPLFNLYVFTEALINLPIP